VDGWEGILYAVEWRIFRELFKLCLTITKLEKYFISMSDLTSNHIKKPLKSIKSSNFSHQLITINIELKNLPELKKIQLLEP
jgi:hypothetical protein